VLVALAAVAVLSLLVAVGAISVLCKRAQKLEKTLDSVTQQLEHLQQSFHRFVPQDVVEDIIHRGVATRGERLEVTVLFADLKGFTAMSEVTPPDVVVRVLNGYFQAVNREIMSHNGFVSKFMGDGLMALFGALEPNPWQAMDAVRAAVQRYNERLKEDGLPPLSVSIGLHCGPVVAGVIGSSELVEYTAIGDVVNTAARIESLTRVHKQDALLSADIAAKLDKRFVLQEMAPHEVKGKSEPLRTFAVERVET
jgi:adenylate cyclase